MSPVLLVALLMAVLRMPMVHFSTTRGILVALKGLLPGFLHVLDD